MTKQQKNIALIVSFVMALILCYNLAIKNTLQLKEQHTNLVNEAVLLKNGTAAISRIKTKKCLL